MRTRSRARAAAVFAGAAGFSAFEQPARAHTTAAIATEATDRII
jgi:hypothetical protein